MPLADTPSRVAALVWSCTSFGFYRRVAGNRFLHTLSYLLLLAVVVAIGVTTFFGFIVLPSLRAAAHALPAMILSNGQLMATTDAPPVLYDDGSHAMLLVRLALDQEPAAPLRRYDAVLTLRARGFDLDILGRPLRIAWPAQTAIEIKPLDAVAFVESWWPLACMLVFAATVAWFFLTRFAHALLGTLLFFVIATPSREVTLRQAFNTAAYALTPGTLLMLGLVWASAFYRFPPALLAWSWVAYAVAGALYLLGAVLAIPGRFQLGQKL